MLYLGHVVGSGNLALFQKPEVSLRRITFYLGLKELSW